MRLTTLLDAYNALARGDIKKVGTAFEQITRRKIREGSKARLVLPPIKVTPTPGDLVYDPDVEGFYRVIHLEPEYDTDFAIVTSLGGTPEKIQVKGNAVKAYLNTISTKELNIDKFEAMKTNYSLQGWLQQNVIKDMEKLETRKFLELAVNAAWGVGQVKGIAAGGWISFETILQEGISTFSENEKAGVLNAVLINAKDFNIMVSNLLGTQAHDTLAKEIITDGLHISTIMGYQFIVTRQSSVVSPGVIYMFARPDWLGEFAIVMDVTFEFKQDINKYTMAGSYSYTMAIANPNGVVVLYDQDKFGALTAANYTELVNWDKYTEKGYQP